MEERLTDAISSKQTGSSSTKGNHHPSFLRFWNWAEEKTVDAAKISGGAEKNVVKTETQQTFVKWIARFYYFRHLYSAGPRVYCSHTLAELPIDKATLSALAY